MNASTDRGASTKTNVAILIVITLLLVVSSAAFFIDFQYALKSDNPKTGFSYTKTPEGDVQIRHQGGDTINLNHGRLYVSDPSAPWSVTDNTFTDIPGEVWDIRAVGDGVEGDATPNNFDNGCTGKVDCS